MLYDTLMLKKKIHFVCCDRWIFNLEEPESALSWAKQQQKQASTHLAFPFIRGRWRKNTVLGMSWV